MKELFWCWVCWRSAPPHSLILERDTARFMNEPGRLESRPGRKEIKCKHVWSCPSSLPKLCPTARIHRSFGNFFFIPLCDSKHPWCSRYRQTVVQRQVAPSTFLNIILLFIDLSEPPCSSCIFLSSRWCKPEIHVWINVTTMQRTLAVESGKESNYLPWDLQQRYSSEADEQAAVNKAGLLPFLNWAPDLPRKSSCAFLWERKMTKQRYQHMLAFLLIPVVSCTSSY